jgi:hypothetical protein
VPGKPPTQAAVIQEPINQRRFSTSPVTVTGTCPANTLVELFKNDIFAGSTICTSAGTFSVEIDLLIGENRIIAVVYDALNQAGPESNSVTVFYDILPAQSPGITPINFGGPQLLISTEAVFRGTFPGQELSMPLSILGGVAPFALNIQWGDSENSVISRNNNSSFSSSHVYKKPGTYQASIQATDAEGRVAFLSVATIVNGEPEGLAGTASIGSRTSTLNSILALWPLYVSLVAIVLSFWFGELREKRVLAKSTQP